MKRNGIGYYQSFLGVVWNNEEINSDFVFRSVKDILDFKEKDKILIPNPKSSAAIEFLMLLSKDSDTTNP